MFLNKFPMICLFCQLSDEENSIQLATDKSVFTLCLNAWSDVSTTSIVSSDDVVNQTIWNTMLILIENKSCCVKHLAIHGIVKRGNLISDNSRFLKSEKLLQT